MSTSIGTELFDIAFGVVQLVKQHMQEEIRPGSDGQAIIAVGTHGEPFELRTKAFFNSYSGAIGKINTYHGMVGITPVNVTHEAVNYETAYGTKYVIKNVTPTEARAIPYTSRAINHSSNPVSPAYVVEASWTLIPIKVS